MLDGSKESERVCLDVELRAVIPLQKNEAGLHMEGEDMRARLGQCHRRRYWQKIGWLHFGATNRGEILLSGGFLDASFCRSLNCNGLLQVAARKQHFQEDAKHGGAGNAAQQGGYP